MKCLALRASERYADMRDVREAFAEIEREIERALRGTGIVASDAEDRSSRTDAPGAEAHLDLGLTLWRRPDAREHEDLDLIRTVPGVINAVASNSVPLRQGGWSMALALEPEWGCTLA